MPTEKGFGSIRVANSITSCTTNLASFQVVSERTGLHVDVENAREIDNKKKGCSKIRFYQAKYPVTFVMVGALIGLCMGIGFSMWSSENPEVKAVTMKWIGLIGDVFIRLLKCIVLPLVFVSITMSVMDMLSLGEAGKIVGTTIGLYAFTTVCAAVIGCVVSSQFARLYTLGDGADAPVTSEIRLECGTGSGTYLTEQPDGSVMCSLAGENMTSTFLVDDLNGYFQQSAAAQGLTELSLSESIYQGLFLMLAPNNFVGVFYDSNFLGAIVLGAGFGVALNKLQHHMPNGIKWDTILIVQLLEELLQIFFLFVNWIIQCTPIAIISLIATAIGSQTNIGEVVASLGALLGAVLTGLFLQFLIPYCGMYIIVKRKNPLAYFKKLIPAFIMAFASASGAATLPVSISCAVASGEVTAGIASFSLPLGATVNMDGGCIYIVCACTWLAFYNGITPTFANYLILVFCATLGSMGAAPVPASLFVLIMTSYQTTFGVTGDVPGLPFIITIDFILDRATTVFNVCGDLAVCAVVSNGAIKKHGISADPEGAVVHTGDKELFDKQEAAPSDTTSDDKAIDVQASDAQFKLFIKHVEEKLQEKPNMYQIAFPPKLSRRLSNFSMTSHHRCAAILAAMAPMGGEAFTATRMTNPRPILQLFADPSIGIFFGTSTGSTEEVAHLISAEFGEVASEPIDIDGLKGSIATAFSKYDSLVVGTPTWHTGADTERSGTGWDEIYYGEMQKLNIAGKKVAVFGLGDSISYGENYADGSGELHDVFQNLGCNMMGYTSQEGYQHKESKAIRGESFCGLLLDAVNEEELTEDRVKNWVAKLLDEGILDVRSPTTDAVTAPKVELAEAAVFEDQALAEEILTEVKKTRTGYIAHYNPRTDKTMWIKTDGRSSYVTTGAPGYE